MAEIQKDKLARVCFVSPKAYPLFDPSVDSVFGGAEVDLYLLATELAKDDKFDVSCITADYGQGAEESIENVTVIKSLSFKQNPITGAIKIWQAMKKANADIYMVKTPSPGVALMAAFCRKYDRSFIYRVASSREFDGTYTKQHPFFSRVFKWSLKSAALIFAQNQADAENVHKTAGFEAVVIPNGHRQRQVSAGDKETILWVGRSADVKKPYRFLELAEKFPGEKFTMICQQATGDNNYQDLLAKAKKIDNLTFIEQVPFVEIDTFFVDAKVFVNTSDSEGFPNTFIQAAKAETAILTYAVNPDNFLDKNNCGITANADMTRLSEELKQILQNNQYCDMGKNGKGYFLNKHDITKIIKQYKDIFERQLLCR